MPRSEDELVAMAKRLIADWEEPTAKGLSYQERENVVGPPCWVELGRAFLARLPPADDGEPVTEEWLRSVGFEQNEYGLRLNSPHGDDWYHHLRHAQVHVRSIDWKWHANGIGVVDQTTRGHVRRLCAAIGLPLKEVAAS